MQVVHSFCHSVTYSPIDSFLSLRFLPFTHWSFAYSYVTRIYVHTLTRSQLSSSITINVITIVVIISFTILIATTLQQKKENSSPYSFTHSITLFHYFTILIMVCHDANQSKSHCWRTLAWVCLRSAAESADEIQTRKDAMLGCSRNMSNILKRGKPARSSRRWSVSAGVDAPVVTRRLIASTMSARASPVIELDDAERHNFPKKK